MHTSTFPICETSLQSRNRNVKFVSFCSFIVSWGSWRFSRFYKIPISLTNTQLFNSQIFCSKTSVFTTLKETLFNRFRFPFFEDGRERVRVQAQNFAEKHRLCKRLYNVDNCGSWWFSCWMVFILQMYKNRTHSTCTSVLASAESSADAHETLFETFHWRPRKYFADSKHTHLFMQQTNVANIRVICVKNYKEFSLHINRITWRDGVFFWRSCVCVFLLLTTRCAWSQAEQRKSSAAVWWCTCVRSHRSRSQQIVGARNKRTAGFSSGGEQIQRAWSKVCKPNVEKWSILQQKVQNYSCFSGAAAWVFPEKQRKQHKHTEKNNHSAQTFVYMWTCTSLYHKKFVFI